MPVLAFGKKNAQHIKNARFIHSPAPPETFIPARPSIGARPVIVGFRAENISIVRIYRSIPNQNLIRSLI